MFKGIGSSGLLKNAILQPLGRRYIGSDFRMGGGVEAMKASMMRQKTQYQGANIGAHLSDYDILSAVDKPDNNIEMISKDSVVFSNMKVVRSPNPQGDPIGCLLLNNQIFEVNMKGCTIAPNDVIFHIDPKICDLLKAVYPKPELLVVGLGKKTRMVSPESREMMNKLGIGLETSDTRYSALNYDLLATERTPERVAALIVPPNW